MMKQTLRITFTGDVMCGSKQDIVAHRYGNDYSGMFSLVRECFSESDYVVGNLETVFAGERLRYTNKPASFNTPETFAYALKYAGFGLLTNANNHIMDRGMDGLVHTLDILDWAGIDHTGAYRNEDESNEILIKRFGDIKVAFIALTYGFNQEVHHNRLPAGHLYHVDLLKRPSDEKEWQFFPSCFLHRKLIGAKNRLYGMLGKENPRRNVVLDCVGRSEIGNPDNVCFLNRALRKISEAKDNADFVVVCLHVGGQSNSSLGDYSKYIFDILKKSKADLIVGNHPHCVLGHDASDGSLATYSLGNFTSIPDDVYFVDGIFAEYSILLHWDIDLSDPDSGRYSFSYLRNIMDVDGFLKPCPVYQLYLKADEIGRKRLLRDLKGVARRFGVVPPKEMRAEYVL